MRAVLDFAPKPTSAERLCAGVVTRLDTGEVGYQCAIDLKRMEHAFGAAGAALHSIAQMLCESLAEHWRNDADAGTWRAPFSGASLVNLSRFSGRAAGDSRLAMLERTSSLHTLLNSYEMRETQYQQGIVERVKNAVRRAANSKHLATRFNRQLELGSDAQPMRVDFLGQHYACYFLQITHSARGIEANTERAFGKLYELQALQRFVKRPRKALGLLDDERPEQFELVMVGARSDAIQRRAIAHVEALADRGKVIARTLPSAAAAAEHVWELERRAA